jgi:anti-sigma-K factor RskA
MTDDGEDTEGLAAEYVLGSLSPAERSEADARRRTDTVLDEAVKAWEARLGTLNDRVEGIEPPPHLYGNIAHQLFGQPVDSTAPALRLQAKRRWRALSIVGGSAAATIALIVAAYLHHLPASPAKLVAELQRSTSATLADETASARAAPGFVVSFDLRTSTIMVSPVAARPAARWNYQLWLIPHESEPPISLGLISLAGSTTSPWPATCPPNDLVRATLAVSLEPEGGSPNGKPSGATVFVGKLVQAMP